jgi:hypothetical protein
MNHLALNAIAVSEIHVQVYVFISVLMLLNFLKKISFKEQHSEK